MPPLASSNIPGLPPLAAPVKAPLAYPKSSLSNNVSGIAAQLIGINAADALIDELCNALANSSLPVPVSPRINMVESLAAYRRA